MKVTKQMKKKNTRNNPNTLQSVSQIPGCADAVETEVCNTGIQLQLKYICGIHRQFAGNQNTH